MIIDRRAIAIAAASPLAVPVTKPNTFAERTSARAAEINANFDVLYTEFEARIIRSDLTIPAADCNGIRTALTMLDDRTIVGSARVTIEVAQGASTCSAPLEVRHRDGASIRIVGQGSNAATGTVLQFAGGIDGILVQDGHALGGLEGMTIQGDGTGGVGVTAVRSAFIRAGPDIIIRLFDQGLVAFTGSTIQADGVTSAENDLFGFHIASGATLVAGGAIASENGIGFLFNAAVGEIFGSQAINNVNAGFSGNVNSTLWLSGVTATGNGTGVAAYQGSYAFLGAAPATVNSNTMDRVVDASGGTIYPP